MFTAPADGAYLVRLKDVRGFEGSDFDYRLSIRPRTPDFNARLTTQKIEAPLGGAAEIRVTVDRLDGFLGPIDVRLENLPPGFSLEAPLVVEAEQIEAFGVIQIASDAEQPTEEQVAEILLVATSDVAGESNTKSTKALAALTTTDDSRVGIEITPAPGGRQPRTGDDGQPIYTMHPGETMRLMVRLDRKGFEGRIEFGGDDSGRNLPYGSYVDNIGLNGLLIPEGQSEREFFITADEVTAPQVRWFHLKTSSGGPSASPPVQIEIVPRD